MLPQGVGQLFLLELIFLQGGEDSKTMFRLFEVSEAEAIHLLHVGVGRLEAEVGVLWVVLDEVMISRQ